MCVLLLTAWILSVTWPVRRIGEGTALMLSGGGFFWSIAEGYTNPHFPRWIFGEPSPTLWLPRSDKEWRSGLSGSGSVFVPIWCVLLPFAILTHILWRRDRRIPPGHCQECGYNLTGNVTGVCSECGMKIVT